MSNNTVGGLPVVIDPSVPKDEMRAVIPATQQQDHVMQYFNYQHLPPDLQEISRPFCELAHWIVANIPRNPERTKSLNDVLTAKDAAVRAALAK